MRSRSGRTAAVLLSALVLGGCSFRASVSEATSPTSSSAGSSSATAAASAPSMSARSSAPAASSTSSSSPGTTAPPAGRPDRCHTSELRGILGQGDAGAGQRYATVVLRNSGDEVCTVRGFGGIQLVDPDGRLLPTQQVRVPDPPKTLVTLAPGASASSALHWTAVAGPGDDQTGDCQPTPATLRVIPPDETDALSIPWTQGPVCGGGRIDQQAYAG